MPEIKEEQVEVKNEYTHFVGVKFLNTPRAYFFGVKDIELAVGDKVVVETVRGTELGEIAIEPITIDRYSNGLLLKPILRKATDTDIKLCEINQKDAVFALEICELRKFWLLLPILNLILFNLFLIALSSFSFILFSV